VRRQQAAEVDSEWGGAPKGRADPSGGWDGGQAGVGVPRQSKYDLKPYDDDDYEPEARTAGKGQGGYQVSFWGFLPARMGLA